ncbi:YlxR family protein [Humibacter ginsengisoli]
MRASSHGSRLSLGGRRCAPRPLRRPRPCERARTALGSPWGRLVAVRTCVGCRSRASRSSLLRVVARNSQLVVDESARMPGRGAWLHPTSECLDKAIRRRAFGRALRVEGPLDTRPLENRLNG